MNKLLSSMFALAVASVTAISAQAQEVKGDAKAAEQKIAMCIGCHGIKGYQASFPEVYRVPMISGQNAKYIAAALNAYKKGERKHPTMRGIADSLSDQDIADVAAYYEQHGKTDAVAKAPAAPDAKVAALLQKGACVSCHGAQLTGVAPDVPGLLGLPLDYLNGQLGAWQSGQRRAHAPDCMVQVVKRLASDDLMAVAQYLARQPLPANTSPVSLSVLRASTATQGAHTSASDWTCGSAPGLVGVQP